MRILVLLTAVALGLVTIGCGPKPVVKERSSSVHTEFEVDRQPGAVIEQPAAPANTGVEVQVDGGKGVDVNVNPPAGQQTDPNP